MNTKRQLQRKLGHVMKKSKSGRPAKINKKKGDRDLEREIKKQRRPFLLEEEDENFTAAVIK